MIGFFQLATLGVDQRLAGAASAMVSTSQQVGGAIGTALLNTLAAVLSERGDVAGSAVFSEEVLRLNRELNDEWGVAQALSDVGWNAVFLGEYARGTPLLEESLASNDGTVRQTAEYLSLAKTRG